MKKNQAKNFPTLCDRYLLHKKIIQNGKNYNFPLEKSVMRKKSEKFGFMLPAVNERKMKNVVSRSKSADYRQGGRIKWTDKLFFFEIFRPK